MAGGLQVPGHVVLIDQYIDRTQHRQDTFYGKGVAGHVSMAHPICEKLRQVLLSRYGLLVSLCATCLTFSPTQLMNTFVRCCIDNTLAPCGFTSVIPSSISSHLAVASCALCVSSTRLPPPCS